MFEFLVMVSDIKIDMKGHPREHIMNVYNVLCHHNPKEHYCIMSRKLAFFLTQGDPGGMMDDMTTRITRIGSTHGIDFYVDPYLPSTDTTIYIRPYYEYAQNILTMYEEIYKA